MSGPNAGPLVRFGVFEFDPATGDLWKAGRRVRLQEQPRQVLNLLLARPGELVTREDLRGALWPDDTFVDFDTGLNVIVNKIRQTLGDSATAPRFIETIPRRGYRFVAPVVPAGQDPLPVRESIDARDAPRSNRGWLRSVLLLAAASVVVAGGLWWSWRHNTAAGPRVRALAVLPFENLSGNADEDYFADGMAEAISIYLTSIRSIDVIGRQSTKKYKGSAKTVSEIAKELGVDGVIQGSMLRTGNKVRLNVQLVDGKNNRQIWAHPYERELQDVLQLQSEVAREVVREIAVTLTPGERTRLAHSRRVNAAAYDAYLRGRYLLAGLSESSETTARALGEFQHAIDLDPSYAPAYAGVAEVWQLRGTNQGGLPPIETRPLAFKAARLAVQLDPDLGEAHSILARVQLSEFDWEGARLSFERMLDLSPGNASGLVWYAYYLLLQGRFEEALTVALKAEALEPQDLNTRVRVGFIHFKAGKSEEAISRFESVLTLEPDNLQANIYLQDELVKAGRYDEALVLAKDAIARHKRTPLLLARLAIAQGRAGNKAEAQRLMDELLAMSLRQYVAPGYLIQAFTHFGDRDRALYWLERGYEERSNFMMLFTINAPEAISSDERYVRLLRKFRQQHSVREGS